MRTIHALIRTEFGKESVAILRRWEQLEKKIANFSNHRRFALRCHSRKITPNSLKLKSNIRTPSGIKIIQRAEKQLRDEHVRSINNTIDICMNLGDTCIKDLKDQINSKMYKNAMNL